MKVLDMSLTAQDLSAIKGIVDTSIETAIETRVKPLITDAIDNLSLQIGQGFNEVTDNFEEVNQRLDRVESDVSELKSDVSELKVDMREVKWSLADTVRRSEFLDVRTRVERLEHQSEH